MPTLNVQLTVNDAAIENDRFAYVRVGEDRYGHDTPDKANHQLAIRDGSVAMEYLPAGGYKVWPFAEGYAAVDLWPRDYVPVSLSDGENPQVTIALAPVGVEVDQLDTYDGGGRLEYGFRASNGRPWFLAGYSAHLLPTLIDQGKDHRPVYQEAISYGANTLIPICQHRSQWKRDNGYYFDPLANEGQFQRVLEVMCDTAQEFKIRLAPAILADADGQSTAQQQRVLDLAQEVFTRYRIVLPRKGNECNVNGYDPERLNMNKSAAAGLLWSHGSYGENNPPLHTGARWAEWEGRRDYRDGYHKAMDDAGAGVLELNRGYFGDGRQIGPFHMPVVGIEMPYFADTDPDHVGDRRWIDLAAALQLGLNLGANAAGMGAGTSLGLECKPNGALAAECMRQQFRGARAAFLRR